MTQAADILDQWRPLAEKALKGKPLEGLTHQTADDLPVYPLYKDGDNTPLHTSARGNLHAKNQKRPWDLRVLIHHPEPVTANALALDGLMGGAASAHISVDPTGQTGVAIDNIDGLKTVLKNVDLSLAPVSIDAGWHTPQFISDALPITATFDPVTYLLRDGTSPGPVDGHVVRMANLAASHKDRPLFHANGQIVHEAGGTEAQELATIIASARQYTDALIRAGISAEHALDAITLGITTDSQFLQSTAKIRALRVLWAGLCGGYGVDVPATIHAISSQRTLSAHDLETNILRLTAATFAAGVGGADVVTTLPYTTPLIMADSQPDELAHRIARNTQLIAIEEAWLGAVSDPLGGAGVVEDLTDKLAHAAWTQFQNIEAEGGILKFIQNGNLQKQIPEFKNENRKVIGVTVFENTAEPKAQMVATAPQPTTAADPRLPGPDTTCQALTPVSVDDLTMAEDA